MTQHQDDTTQQTTPRHTPVDRRAALKRLGLAASVAYLAPTLATLKSAGAKSKKSKKSGPSITAPTKPSRS